MAKYKQTIAQWSIVRPLLEKVMKDYTTDPTLVSYTETILNNTDSRLVSGLEISPQLGVIYGVLSDENYYKNVHVHSSSEERKFLSETLAPELELLLKLASSEERIEEKIEEVKVERLPNIGADVSNYDKVKMKDRLI